MSKDELEAQVIAALQQRDDVAVELEKAKHRIAELEAAHAKTYKTYKQAAEEITLDIEAGYAASVRQVEALTDRAERAEQRVAELERARDVIDDAPAEGSVLVAWRWYVLRDRAERAKAEGVPVPVAWQWRSRSTNQWVEEIDEEHARTYARVYGDGEVRALYTHPAHPAPEKAEQQP